MYGRGELLNQRDDFRSLEPCPPAPCAAIVANVPFMLMSRPANRMFYSLMHVHTDLTDSAMRIFISGPSGSLRADINIAPRRADFETETKVRGSCAILEGPRRRWRSCSREWSSLYDFKHSGKQFYAIALGDSNKRGTAEFAAFPGDAAAKEARHQPRSYNEVINNGRSQQYTIRIPNK